ncbi:hypothetical protein PSHT_09156 [Puccinia striiformis]|uniref:UBL3-like ubiquitin domain-containing protein n=1 Tax=Puccinia striiformis TaxID=27350 RepID=A0A2S4VIJ5_9BASI|nr:hypothetical protein PSHT_09156 [Puccinia striiformis]
MMDSRRSSLSSTSTIIEAEQQEQSERVQQEENGEEEEEHLRRLRLIEGNRTRTRLIEEEEPLPPHPTTTTTTDQINKDSSATIIPVEILLSPFNLKKTFYFDHLCTISELILNLLNNWPSGLGKNRPVIVHLVIKPNDDVNINEEVDHSQSKRVCGCIGSCSIV